MRTRLLWAVSSVLATGCGLTTAGGLEQCQVSADCGTDQVCTEGFCLPLPAGCGKLYGSSDSNAIQLGALLPISTSTQPDAGVDESDQQSLNAALLALEEVNQRKVDGRPLALHFCDTAGDTERTRKQAEWLVKEKKVPAVLTAGSSQTLTAQQVTVSKGVLTMSYSASSPELTSLPDTAPGGQVGLVWRTSPSDAIQGRVIADQLRDNPSRFPGLLRVGILYVDDPYGQGLFNIISERLTSTSSLDLMGVSYPRRGDVKAALVQLNTYDPDLTVLMGFADDTTAIIKEAVTQSNLSRSSGHRWFFSDSVKDATVLADPQVRDEVQGFYGTAPAQGTGQAFASFSSRFYGKYGKVPDGYAYTSNAYDALYLLALGAAYSQGTSGEVTGAKMAEGLTKVSTGFSGTHTQLTNSNFTYLAAELARSQSVNVEGASGKLDFDPSGEAPAPIELWQVYGQSFTKVEVLEAN